MFPNLVFVFLFCIAKSGSFKSVATPYNQKIHLSMISSSTTTTTTCKAIGIDFGTSGVRCCCIDDNKNIVFEDSVKWNSDVFDKDLKNVDEIWIRGLHYLLASIPIVHRESTVRICLSGTSGSVLLYDCIEKKVSQSPRMYNYDAFSISNTKPDVVDKVKKVLQEYCPKNHPASLPTSTLPKLLSWHFEQKIYSNNYILAHQADYIVHELLQPTETKTSVKDVHFSPMISDWNNCLKLGYDAKNEKYPVWLLSLLTSLGYEPFRMLPRVVAPGSVIGNMKADLITKYNFHKDCKIVSGTTDSIAAFLAAGVDQPGQAVTSLGSTLAVKLLSTVPVEDSARGIYSHRLGKLWLVGGASNTGCLVLRNEGFSDSDLVRLSELVNPHSSTGLHYYPLSGMGERFPISDPHKQPLLTPKPSVPDDISGIIHELPSSAPKITCRDTLWRKIYLQGILEGIANIEKEGYDALSELGATTLREVYTSGGGSKNSIWTEMRQNMLKVPTKRAANVEASYGCSLLALRAKI